MATIIITASVCPTVGTNRHNKHDNIFHVSGTTQRKWISVCKLGLFFPWLFSWQCSGASCSPQRRKTYSKVWWTTSVCSSLSAVAPSALPSALSYRRCHLLKATSTTTDAAGPRAHTLSYSNTVTCSDCTNIICTVWTTVQIFPSYCNNSVLLFSLWSRKSVSFEKLQLYFMTTGRV